MGEMRLFTGLLTAGVLVSGVTRPGAAQQDTAAARDSQLTVAERLEQLDQKVRILARILELKQDSAAAAAKQEPRVVAGKEGFVLKSPDGAFQLKARGYIQADGRFFPSEAPATLGTSNLFLRRARPVIDATLWKYFGLRLAPDFGQGRVVLFDAYLDFRPAVQFGLRAGKTKPPLGLERLQSATDIRFIERGLPTNLVPNRDVGLQLFGDIAGGHLSYAVGVFNGVADLGNGDGDVTNDKDFVARVFAKVGGLGLGIAASTGIEHGTIAAPALPTYVSPAQQAMFRYRDSTIANGRRIRVAPQAYWYAGPFGVLGEYIISEQDLTRTTSSIRVANRGWQVAASWFVTGEKAAFTTVAPRRPFDPQKKSWGALEVGARYGELHPDEDAFPTYAVVGNSVTSAKAWGAGITWHLAPAVRFAVNYEQTKFTDGAASGDRTPEKFLVVRIQQSF
jgi:phosphate-selective porin OprO/OprP